MKLISAVVAASALTGCAMTLRPDNATTVVVESPNSVERTYRNILGVIEVCYPVLHTVESNYFPEAKEGVVSLSTANEHSRIWFFKLTVSTVDGKTQMRMQRRSNFPKFSESLAAWADGKEGGCPYGSKDEPRPPGSAQTHQNLGR